MKNKNHEKKPIEMRFDKYATNPSDYKTWVDHLYEVFKFPFPIPSLLVSIVVFIVGWLISVTINFQEYYLNSKVIYIASFGIFWVICVIRLGSQSFHEAYSNLRPCFLISDEEYSLKINKTFKRLADNKGSLISSLFVFLFALLIIYFAYFQIDLIEELGMNSMMPDVIGIRWFTSIYREIKILILVVLALFCAIPLGTAMRYLVINFFFLIEIGSFPVIPIPNVIKFRLKNISDIYVQITLAWFIGVSLFGILLFNNIDIFSIFGLIFLSLFGVITFITPQVLYRNYLVRSSKLVSQWTLSTFYDKLDIYLVEEEQINYDLFKKEKGLLISNFQELVSYFEVSQITDYWIYNPVDIILFVFGQSVAIAGVFLSF